MRGAGGGSPPIAAARANVGRVRTLVVGPIGSRPWISMAELVEDLEALGQDVIVNGEPDDVLPLLRPLPPRLGWIVNSRPATVAWLAQMILRWRRTARKSLKRSRVDQVVVWDEVLALLARLARPRGVTVVWVAGEPEGTRLHQRLRRAAVTRTSDRVVRAVPLPVCAAAGAEELLDGWVVFGSARPVSAANLQLLTSRAEVAPAAALVFNAREHDDVSAECLARLCDAARPNAVWWCGDGEWVRRLGGVPLEAVDPSDDVTVDHRHVRALGCGATVVSPAGTIAPPEGFGMLDDDHAWAAHALGGDAS